LVNLANELDNVQFIIIKKNSVEYDIRIYIKSDEGLWKIKLSFADLVRF